MWRVEDKYALPVTVFEELRAKFLNALPVDRGGTYQVSSVYFDDYWDTCLNNTIDGQPVREKFRVRIYDDCLDTIKLEHKIKKYARIHKDSVLIEENELKKLLYGETLKSEDDVCDAFNCAIATRCLKPKIIVNYQRTAFIYSKGNVRVTFDENLRASKDICKFGCSDLYYDYPKTPFKVVEVKYDEFLPDFIANLLDCGNMWQSANSKYRICRELYGL